MKTLVVSSNQRKLLPIEYLNRLKTLARPENTTWDLSRLVVFAARIGAKNIKGTYLFVDSFGCRFTIGDV